MLFCAPTIWVRKHFPHSTTRMTSWLGQLKVSIQCPPRIRHILQTSAHHLTRLHVSAIYHPIDVYGVSRLSVVCTGCTSLPTCQCFHFHGRIQTAPPRLLALQAFIHALDAHVWLASISIPKVLRASSSPSHRSFRGYASPPPKPEHFRRAPGSPPSPSVPNFV